MFNMVFNIFSSLGLTRFLATVPPRKLFDLPQEIIDSILDHLAQDSHLDQVSHRTLWSCLFVSKAFTRRAWQNLLLDISVSQQTVTWPHQKAVMILDILQREPLLLARIRSIRLCIPSTTRQSDHQILDFVHMAASHCMDLKHLAFKGPGVNVDSFSLFYNATINHIIITISRTHLTSLVVIRVVDFPIRSAVLSCRHLERLELVDCHFFDDDYGGIRENQDPPMFYQTLTSLLISNENNQFFAKIPSVARGQNPMYSKLKLLRWEFSTAEDLEQLRLQLGSAPLLETLELTHRTNGDLSVPLDISIRVELSERRNLKSVTLNIIASSAYSLANTMDCRMFSASAIRSSTTLQIININVTTHCVWHNIEDFMEGNHCGWNDLDVNLSNDGLFPCLTHVNLRFHLLPVPRKTLPSLAELKTEFSVLYRFGQLECREGVQLTTSVTRG